MLYDLFTDLSERRGSQLYGLCPLHEEKTPSFTVNEDTQEWFCHGCNKGGSVVEFLMLYYDITSDTAQYIAEYYSQKHTLPLPKESEIEQYHRDLMVRPSEIEHLEEFGITEETLIKYQIGFESNRITIPIRNKDGRCVNIRKYLPEHRRIKGSKSPKCINIRGLGGLRYFPRENLEKGDTVYIVEGEKDCLAAISQGYNTVTGTGGSNIPTRELAMFQGKKVYLMLDNDAVGSASTVKYIKLLKGIAAEIYTVRLPKKDYAETFRVMGRVDLAEYTEPVGEQARLLAKVESTEDERAIPIEELSLIQSEFVDNLNTWMLLRGMSVIGTDPKIYTLPSKLRVFCNNSKCSKQCPVAASQDGIEIDIDSRQMLRFMESSDTAQVTYAKELYGCKYVRAEPTEYINAQKIMFQETASFVEGLEDATFESRYGVYIYNGYRLAPTLKYTMEACRVTDPRSQQNYYVIRKATQERDSVAPSDDSYLEYFREMASGVDSFEELVEKHYSKWKPLLGIEGRPDLFATILLTYLSVTEIRWKGGIIKGWLDSIVIGDTRTGKSQMLQRFVKSLKLGSYINGENSRKTGVVGGVQRFGDSWVVSWGAIPMNDRGLLIVDEASGLSVEDFKELSSTRSSGAVTINKIVKSEARARTRLIWASNPRSGKNLADYYWKGYDAFQEFIPVAEDQARFDIVVTAAREDVKQLKGISEPTAEEEINLDLYRNIVNFAWEVRADDIIVPAKVSELIDTESRELGEKYGGGPLIVEVAVHEKLLRLSVAIAILCGSVNSSDVVVSEKHVKYAVQMISDTLEKKSFGYSEYINESKKAVRELDKSISFIKGICATYPAMSVLLSSNSFRGSQMSEVLGLDRGEHAKLLSELLQRGLIHLGRSGYYTPDKFMVEIVKQVIQGGVDSSGS